MAKQLVYDVLQQMLSGVAPGMEKQAIENLKAWSEDLRNQIEELKSTPNGYPKCGIRHRQTNRQFRR